MAGLTHRTQTLQRRGHWIIAAVYDLIGLYVPQKAALSAACVTGQATSGQGIVMLALVAGRKIAASRRAGTPGRLRVTVAVPREIEGV